MHVPVEIRRPFSRTAVTALWAIAVTLLAASLVFAQETAAPTQPVYGLDRVVFALGVLIALAKAMEAFFIALNKCLLKLFPPTPKARETTPSTPAVPDLVGGWRIPITLVLAFGSGIDTLDVLSTGVVNPRPWDLDHLVGCIVTGLVASMGSDFLSQLIELLKALAGVIHSRSEQGRARAEERRALLEVRVAGERALYEARIAREKCPPGAPETP